MIRRLLSWAVCPEIYHRRFGFLTMMEFLRGAFEGDNGRVCRVRLEGGRP